MAEVSGEGLRIRAERRGRIGVLAVSGRLDMATSARLTERIAAERAGQLARLVIDMSGVAIVDSSGARALAAAASPAPGVCPVIVRSLRPTARRLLELIGASPGPAALNPGDADPEETGPRVHRPDAALAASTTGVLVRQWRHLRVSAEQAIADSRRTAQYLASTQDQVAATMRRAAVSRPESSSRLENLSQTARGHALRLRLRDQTGPQQVPAAEGATGTLRRAIAFIQERARDDISVTDIAAAAFVTIRAVQLAFRRYLDTTPMAYLRQVRLERAHCELVLGDPRHVTVAQVASDWGFPNASRFTAYYRAAYGVPPGQTLRHRR
jgi:anti-anti-sigma factor